MQITKVQLYSQCGKHKKERGFMLTTMYSLMDILPDLFNTLQLWPLCPLLPFLGCEKRWLLEDLACSKLLGWINRHEIKAQTKRAWKEGEHRTLLY